MLCFSRDNLSPEFKRFFLLYNILLLGTLCVSLITSALYLLYVKLTFGLWWIGPFGFLPGVVYIALLAISVIAWSLACIKTWLLTKDALRIRALSFLYLFISPIIIGSVFYILVKYIILPNAS